MTVKDAKKVIEKAKAQVCGIMLFDSNNIITGAIYCSAVDNIQISNLFETLKLECNNTLSYCDYIKTVNDYNKENKL